MQCALHGFSCRKLGIVSNTWPAGTVNTYHNIKLCTKSADFIYWTRASWHHSKLVTIQARVFKMQSPSSYVLPHLDQLVFLSKPFYNLDYLPLILPLLSHRTHIYLTSQIRIQNCFQFTFFFFQKIHSYDISVHSQNYFALVYWSILILCCLIFPLCVNETFTVLRRNGLIYLYLHKYITL